MLLHGNAKLTPFQRTLLSVRVRDEGWTVEEAAEAAGCWQRTVYRWLARHAAGEPMTDRSSAPKSCPTRTPASVEAEIERLRRLRYTSTKFEATLELPTSTVCAVLKRLGLNRLWKLGPARTTEPVLPSPCRRPGARRCQETRPVPSSGTPRSRPRTRTSQLQERSRRSSSMCVWTSRPASRTSKCFPMNAR